MFKLFKIEEGDIVFDREEILLVKEFRKILTKDKGSEGDYDGRKKVRANQEFKFIYFFADYTSPYIDRDDTDRMRVAKLEAELPVDWKPDEHVVEALKKYRSFQDSFAIKSFVELKRGLQVSYEAINMLNAQNGAMIKLINSKLKGDDDISNLNPADLVVYNDALIGNINKLNGLANTVVTALTTIEKYEQKIKQEESNEAKIRGGGGIGNRELPR